MPAFSPEAQKTSTLESKIKSLCDRLDEIWWDLSRLCDLRDELQQQFEDIRDKVGEFEDLVEDAKTAVPVTT